MNKSLRDYIAESEQWVDNPMPGDDFAINFREECLVESYILETKKNSIVIDADEEMIRIMESYGCKLEDLDEQMSVDDVLVSEDPTEEEPTAPGTMGAVDEPTGYDPIGEDFMGRMLELAGCGRKAMEGDISQVEKDIADAPVAPMGTISEADNELGSILAAYPDEVKHFKQGGDLDYDLESALWDYYFSRGDIKNYNADASEYIAQQLAGELGLTEAEYQGRKVPLGKPMRGDVKKFKVYVRDPKSGNIKKVNFGHGGTSAKRAGQKTMKIKKSDPARRRSFRARHNCDNPGPRTKARYWSCRAW